MNEEIFQHHLRCGFHRHHKCKYLKLSKIQLYKDFSGFVCTLFNENPEVTNGNLPVKLLICKNKHKDRL